MPEQTAEENLDPQDWDELRALGHRMVDDMFAYMQTLRERPVWQPTPDEVSGHFRGPLPVDESPAEEAYEQFLRDVVPYSMGNPHPRFWGWVMGNGTPLAMLADMLASGLNPNMGGGNHSGHLIERQVIDWCKEMLGYPPEASGLLVSGGSMANFNALAVARNAKARYDVRQQGLGVAPKPLTMYGSVEMHSSIQRAVELLGLGNWSLRRIPVDSAFKIDLDALRRTIAADISQGMQPICVIGNASGVNTGAIDPLNELADIAAEHNLWYHVDGAFGALAYMSPDLRPLLAGMERADSLAFDLHKWVYLPFEVGCVLVRDAEAHRHTFMLVPDYLKPATRGLAGSTNWPSEYGIQLTRGFRALKVWMALKTYGAAKIGRIIRQNVEQARYLTDLVEKTPQLQLLAPTELNIVNFRFVAPGLGDDRLNPLNAEILIRLQESGVAAPSSTYINGRYAIRCAITNHRSTRADFDLLVSTVVKIGEGILAEARPRPGVPTT